MPRNKKNNKKNKRPGWKAITLFLSQLWLHIRITQEDFKSPDRLHPRPIIPKSLGVGSNYQCFFKLPRRFQHVAMIKNKYFRKRDWTDNILCSLLLGIMIIEGIIFPLTLYYSSKKKKKNLEQEKKGNKEARQWNFTNRIIFMVNITF